MSKRTNGIDLELLVSAAQKGTTYSITGIPDKVWEIFKQSAKEMMPEKGETAWSSVLTEFITSHIDQRELFTFIMTSIPREAVDILDTTARSAGMSLDALIATLFMSSQQGTFHLINMGQGKYDPDDDSLPLPKTIVITGLSSAAWAKWSQVAEKMSMPPEFALGMFFQGVEQGSVTFEQTGAPIDFNRVVKPDNFGEVYQDIKEAAENERESSPDPV